MQDMYTVSLLDSLHSARSAAIRYHADLEGRTTYIQCEDGLDFMVRWDAPRFIHLCGLRARGGWSAARVYERLLSVDNIARLAKYVEFSESAAHVEGKLAVIMDALSMRNAVVVVDSQLRGSPVAVGTSDMDDGAQWCLGMAESGDTAGESPVFFPRSLRRQNATDPAVMKPHGRVYRIEHLETR